MSHSPLPIIIKSETSNQNVPITSLGVVILYTTFIPALGNIWE